MEAAVGVASILLHGSSVSSPSAPWTGRGRGRAAPGAGRGLPGASEVAGRPDPEAREDTGPEESQHRRGRGLGVVGRVEDHVEKKQEASEDREAPHPLAGPQMAQPRREGGEEGLPRVHGDDVETQKV